MNITDLLRRVMHEASLARAEKEAAGVAPVTWSFNEDWKLVVNPEVKCPSCTRWFSTGQVWLVDENSSCLRGIWEARTGLRKPISRAHPHVFHDGSICEGDFESNVAALIGGINFEDYANSDVPPRRYLRNLGDDCEATQRERCGYCNGLYNIADMVEYDSYWICKECENLRKESK